MKSGYNKYYGGDFDEFNWKGGICYKIEGSQSFHFEVAKVEISKKVNFCQILAPFLIFVAKILGEETNF